MHWELLQRARAVDNNVFVATCSPSRNYESPDSYQAYGYSSIIDPFGRIINTTQYEESIVSAPVDLDLISKIGDQIPTLKKKRLDLYD